MKFNTLILALSLITLRSGALIAADVDVGEAKEVRSFHIKSINGFEYPIEDFPLYSNLQELVDILVGRLDEQDRAELAEGKKMRFVFAGVKVGAKKFEELKRDTSIMVEGDPLLFVWKDPNDEWGE